MAIKLLRIGFQSAQVGISLPNVLIYINYNFRDSWTIHKPAAYWRKQFLLIVILY